MKSNAMRKVAFVTYAPFSVRRHVAIIPIIHFGPFWNLERAASHVASHRTVPSFSALSASADHCWASLSHRSLLNAFCGRSA